MKRLIGIAVIFGLVTASAFAQLQFSGQIRAGAELIMLDSGKDDGGEDTEVQMGRLGPDSRFEVRAGNDREAGDVGAVLRITDINYRAFVWWRPIDMVRLQFGVNGDGEWGLAGFNGWSFLGDPMDLGVARRTRGGFDSYHGRGFYAGMNHHSILASLYPIDGLTINIGLPLNGRGGQFGPFGTGSMALAEDAYKMINAQIIYNIDNIGSVRFTYQGGRLDLRDNADLDISTGINERNTSWQGPHGFTEAPALWLSFWSASQFVQGLDFNIGVGYEIPVEKDDITYQDPMQIGLGVRYTSGDFQVLFRSAFTMIGSVKGDGWEYKDATEIGFNILPNYNLGFMRVFVNLGLGIAIPDEGDAELGWTVNPYIRVPVGGLQFFAGLVIQGQTIGEGVARGTDPDQVVSFRLPLGVVWSF